MFGRKKEQERPPITTEQIAEGVTLSSDGRVSISIADVPSGKRAIKQIRIKKKELGLEKRAVNAEMQAIRSARRSQVANQLPSIRGGGKWGRGARAMMAASRSSDRSRHASALAPLDAQKAGIDATIALMDQAIVHIERYIAENT